MCLRIISPPAQICGTGIRTDVCVRMDVCVDMLDMCAGMCADMCVDMCMDMRVDMCADMCADMCMGVYGKYNRSRILLPYIYTDRFVPLSTHMSIHMSIHMYMYLSVHMPIHMSFTRLYIR